ncbi:MAG: dienelactone hydrolase family protein [Methylococcales bacterium]|jgi:carboxymethylenebutenolidase|nr:dienelactone hydrolase family protein [Methylococcales bacterium]MBT7444892.1 dienelactone hydrolase family protein [Methylococcales bacterium]
MIISEDYTDLNTPTGLMRTHLFKPVAKGVYPGVVLFSEIYQMTGPIARAARKIACEGYIVAVPEVYHEFEPLGTALAYDAEGTDKGNQYKIDKPIQAFDDDAKAVLAHLLGLDDCNGALGTMGICLGGHLSFRAAMNPSVSACVCLYPTDIHTSTLGQNKNDNSLQRMPDINAELLMVWGRQDPHVPQDGRKKIYDALVKHERLFNWHEMNAQHAFTRDEGHRYDSALTDLSYLMVFELFKRRLLLREPLGLTENPGPNLSRC